MNEFQQSLRLPEEVELELKKEELARLENELAQRELELETLRAQLAAFMQEYMRVVGVRLAELDRIEAEIAELLARRQPADATAAQQASEARTRAEKSAEATQEVSSECVLPRFEPSEELKRLYRDVAKQIHPDLAEDETERERRHKLMAEANDAYRNCDIERLKAILHEWQCSPEAVKDKGVAGDLVRVIRKISLVRNRLVAIDLEMKQMMATELYELWQAAELARDDGRDLLQEMAAAVEADIATARRRLRSLTRTRRAHHD